MRSQNSSEEVAAYIRAYNMIDVDADAEDKSMSAA